MSGTTPIGTLPPRKSFAQVAAAANRPIVVAKKDSVQKDSSNGEKTMTQPANSNKKPTPGLRSPPPALPLRNDGPIGPATIDSNTKLNEVDSVAQGLRMSMQEDKLTPLSASSDGITRKDNSDTKSVASRTTLTLDEKESLRPDDSASMQAAVEEDTFSPSGSVVAASGQDSDPDAHAFRAQLNEISLNDTGRVIMPCAQRPQGLVMAEQRGSIGIGLGMRPVTIGFPNLQIVNNFATPQVPIIDGPQPQLTGMWIVPPDEKLLEALASPKDRLFVLKVEQDFIDFIKDPQKEQTLQLPGTNSFYRMLSHKLADYYMLGHFVDDTMSSVKVYRTPNCRLPPPLIGSTPGTNNSTPPPTAQARKIMRRGRARGARGGNDDNFDSFNSSKATSDIGSGEDSKNADKGALTREERENRYKEARARIFKDFEVQPNGETVAGQADPDPSRSSSTSGVKKNKKRGKQRDDGFEARSAFDSYGRRLSEHAYSQISPDGNYEQCAFNTEKQYTSPSGPTPQNGQGYPIMGYTMPNGNAATPMSQWMPQNMDSSRYQSTRYAMGSPAYTSDPYSANSGFDNIQYSSPMGPEHTPKGTAPAISGYGQQFMPQVAQTPWAPQEGYANSYGPSPMYQYQGYGTEYSGFYQNQMMHSAAPAAFNPYSNQNFQPYFQDGMDHQQSFNPRSQAFVPGMRSGGGQGNGPFLQNNQPTQFTPNPTSYQTNMQRQPANTISQSSFNASQHSHNGRAKINPNSHPTNGSRQQPFPQQSSITKWPAPANLPAKPPQPLNGMPNMVIPRDAENSQPLPPKPIPTR